MSPLLKYLAPLLGALMLATPGFAAAGGDLGTTSEATQGTMFGTGGVQSSRTARDTAGNPIGNTGYPAVPSQEEVYQGSVEAARGGRYNPDNWTTEILRQNSVRSRQGQPFRPSVNHMVGTQVNNSTRVVNTLAAERSGNMGGGGNSSWTDLARVLTQIFNGWDA